MVCTLRMLSFVYKGISEAWEGDKIQEKKKMWKIRRRRKHWDLVTNGVDSKKAWKKCLFLICCSVEAEEHYLRNSKNPLFSKKDS